MCSSKVVTYRDSGSSELSKHAVMNLAEEELHLKVITKFNESHIIHQNISMTGKITFLGIQ